MKTKIMKFCAWLMAAALAFAGAGAAQAETVAKIGETSYETLAAAFDAAKDGDTVNLLAASYTENDLGAIAKLHNKQVVVVGLGMAETELKVVYGKSASDVNGLHFQDLTLTINHSGYGMPYTQTLCGTYERVKINGLIAVDHGTSSFKDCVFTGTTTGDEYILWQYAGVMLVEGCTFKASASKGVVKLYCESSYEAQNLVKDCVFLSVTGSKGCAIYASNSNNLDKPIYEMNIVGNTIPAGVAEYAASGNGLTVVNPVKDANGKITSGTFITANANTEQVKGIIAGVVAEGVEIPEIVNGQIVIGAAAPEVEVVTPTVSEEKGITQEIINQIVSNTEVTKVEETGLQAALAGYEELKEKEAVVKVELTEVEPATGVLTYEIKPVVKGEGETPDEDISVKVVGKPITFRVPLTDAFSKFAKVTHKGEPDEISHVEVLGAAGSRFVELTFNHFSEVEFDPELQFPGLPETAVKVADGFYQSAATYTVSTDFYIVSKAGLKYFRDVVNGKDAFDAYIASDCGKNLTVSDNRFTGKTVNLLADIDLAGEDWEPIGWKAQTDEKKCFYGNFDGCNHVISNVRVEKTETASSNRGVGFFGNKKDGEIKNLTIDGISVKGYQRVAGLVGEAASAIKITNCHIKGSVDIYASSGFVGAFVGLGTAIMTGCSLESDDEAAKISGSHTAGGLVGAIRANSRIEECAVSNVNVTARTAYKAGGVAGAFADGATGAVISKCAVEKVAVENSSTEADYAGSTGLILGGNVEGSAVNYNAVLDCEAKNSTAFDQGVAITTFCGAKDAASIVCGSDIVYDENGKIKGGTFESLPESAIAEGFVPEVDSETGKIGVVPDPITGSGTEADPYVISDLKGLKAFRDRVNAGNTYEGKFVKLGDNIDLASVENWEPIGTAAHPFMGSFDGDNKTISNLKINATTQYQGLFGYVKANSAEGPYPTLKNLTLANVDVKTTAGYAGGFAGKVWCCTVENITVKGSVNAGKVYNHSWIGGVMGHSYGTARNCRFEGSVVGYGSVGGISGASGDTKFYDCAVNGDISGNYWVGGIAGNGQEGTSCTRCTVKGTISADRNYYGGTGGIAGAAGMYSSCTFEDNYFDGVVKIGDTEIGNPVIGAVNAGADVAATVKIEGNSWNTEKIPNDVTVAVIGMDMPGLADNTTEEQARAVAQRTEDRNANLVGSVKDLEFVGSGVVEIAAGSAIADMTPAQIQEKVVEADPTKTVEIVDGKVVVTENVAKIGGAMFPTLAKAFEAAAGMSGSADAPIVIELFPGTIEEGTVKLPSVLKNVKMVGAANKATTIKNTRIMASDGGAWDYENLTFEGAVYENSQFVITGCRASEVCTAKNFAFIVNEFKDIVNADNNAPIHFVVGEGEPVNGLRVEGNMIDGVSGSQNSGIYVTCLTGDFIVRNNTIANCSYREMNIGIITTDGIDDNVVITDNLTYGNYAEMQIYGEGSATTDSVSWNVSYNILDNESTVADSMCLYRTNPEKTTFVLDHNYYRKNPDTNPGSFYLNGTRTAADIENYGVYPYYASYDKEALAAGASVREVLRDLTGAVAAVVSAGGSETNEYKKLSKALDAAQQGEKVILLANTDEANVPLKPDQEIILNGFAFTGSVDPAFVPAGYDAQVTTPDGRVFSAPAKVEVPIGESSVIKVRMEGTGAELAEEQDNGRPLWANKALGIANDFKILPEVKRPTVGSKTITIKSNIPDETLAAAAQQRDGVSVKFQLAKKVGNVGTYVQFGDKKEKPEFTVEADEQEVQTFWKIQVFFEEEY